VNQMAKEVPLREQGRLKVTDLQKTKPVRTDQTHCSYRANRSLSPVV
jgi:hypothetical protein